MRTSTIAGALAVAALAAVPAAANAATTTSYLDSHEAKTAGDNYAGPSTNAQVLTAGRPYQVNIAGIISVYAKANWTSSRFTTCGKKGVPPSFPSPGVDSTGPTGSDIATRFALVTTGTCPTLPQNTTNAQFSLDGGATFVSPGAFTKGGGSNYNYRVIGQGRPLEVRYFDPSPQDNYGRFRIRVTPLSR